MRVHVDDGLGVEGAGDGLGELCAGLGVHGGSGAKSGDLRSPAK